jgi:hypothetical protein
MAGGGRKRAPYGAAVTAAEKPEPVNSKPAAAHPRWVRAIGNYDRCMTTEVEGRRFG